MEHGGKSKRTKGYPMRERESRDYFEFRSCLWILRHHTGMKPLFCLIDLLDWAVSEVEMDRMLAYLARKGQIARRGTGDQTQVSLLSAEAPEAIQEQKTKLARRNWNGKWNLLVYDIPEPHARVRMRLVRLLHAMGFAKQSGSAWISPYDWSGFLRERLDGWNFGGTVSFLRDASMVQLAGDAPSDPSALWDLEAIRARYQAVAGTCRAALRAAGVAGARNRARVGVWAHREMTELARQDPMLPQAALPSDWPAQAAEESLLEVRDMLNEEVRQATS